MRIAIDAREVTGQVTGVGRYLSRLLAHWRAAATPHDFVLYAHRPVDAIVAAGFPVRVLEGAGGTFWEQVTLARAIERDAPDVVFCPAYTVPLRTRVPRVVTIHDVSFVAHPEWFRWREGLRRRVLTLQSAEAARTVLTVSEFSKREITEQLRLPADKVRVVLHGVDAADFVGDDDVRAPRVLFVGSIFNRRHVPELVDAVTQVGRQYADVSLDLVGDDRSYPALDIAALIAAGEARQIRWHRYVTDEQLHTLYRHARAFAFLSEYEGFGLTPLEAIARGVPPVLFDTPVARESCGNAAVYAPLGNTAAVADALTAVLFDDSVRRQLRAAAPGVLARYDWATAAEQTLAALTDTH